MEKGLSYPNQAVLTNAIEHERHYLKMFMDDKECFYGFDHGYLDYERFDCMTDDGYFFVTRLRKTAFIKSQNCINIKFILYSYDSSYLK